MPRRHFATRRVASQSLTATAARRLLGGLGLAPPEWGPEYDRATFDANARAAWEAHRDQLLDAWIGCFPTSRPWGWWQYSAPEPRWLVSGPGNVAARRAIAQGRTARLSWGLPAARAVEDFQFVSEYETEVGYLERLGLLTDAERAAVVDVSLAKRIEHFAARVRSSSARPIEAVLIALHFPPYRLADLSVAERAAYLELRREFGCEHLVSDAPPTPYQSPDLAVNSDDEATPADREGLPA